MTWCIGSVSIEAAAVAAEQEALDREAPDLERRLRAVMGSGTPEEELLMRRWFQLVSRRNALVHRSYKLSIMYIFFSPFTLQWFGFLMGFVTLTSIRLITYLTSLWKFFTTLIQAIYSLYLLSWLLSCVFALWLRWPRLDSSWSLLCLLWLAYSSVS